MDKIKFPPIPESKDEILAKKILGLMLEAGFAGKYTVCDIEAALQVAASSVSMCPFGPPLQADSNNQNKP